MYQQTAAAPVRSTVPVRLDRLGWSSLHWRVIDDRLRDAGTIDLTSSQVGFGASVYLFGEAS